MWAASLNSLVCSQTPAAALERIHITSCCYWLGHLIHACGTAGGTCGTQKLRTYGCSKTSSTMNLSLFLFFFDVLIASNLLNLTACIAQSGNDQVATAYASALVEVAESKGDLESVHADMDALSSILKENTDLHELLQNPIIADDNKKSVIQSLAKECDFNDATWRFLQLIVDKGRIDCIEEIVDSFEAEYCKLTDTQVKNGVLGLQFLVLSGRCDLSLF